MENIDEGFWRPTLFAYARAIKDKTGALDHVVGFIYGTVVGIARLGKYEITQRVAHNDHKRKHALKYQAVKTPCR